MMSVTMAKTWHIAGWAGAIACTVLGAGFAAAQQPYPSRPIRIVVPFPAGGAVDTVSRVVGQRLADQVGQSVVIDNRPGAGANLGAELVAKAAPDGHTVLMGANGLATNVTLVPNLPFHTLRDFAPIARVGHAPLILVTAAQFPAKTLKELIAMAKAQPGKLTYGSSGNGGAPHLASEMFKIAAGIDVLHVPYKGGAPGLVDLLGGRTSFMFQNPLEALPHIRSQRLRGIATSSLKRLPLLPDVPTFTEAGVRGFEASVWWALVAPAKTPPDVVAKLNAETVKALADPGVREKLAEMGAVTDPSTAAELGKFLKEEVEKWAKVIKTSGIKIE
jgi:tripartite-type tricarboxylate transporter receptor subunit TctC